MTRQKKYRHESQDARRHDKQHDAHPSEKSTRVKVGTESTRGKHHAEDRK